MRGAGRQKKVFADEPHLQILGADGLRARLNSFIDYTGAGIILNLARAGFYATIFPAVVQCTSCKIYLHDLLEKDDPFILHFLSSPDCVFVRNWPSPPEITLALRNTFKRTKGCGFCQECIVNQFKL